jgi:hypothetical protein
MTLGQGILDRTLSTDLAQIPVHSRDGEAEETMARDTCALDVIEVDVTGFFTTHHYFETEAGPWGELTFPAFSDHGTFHAADGRELVVRQIHWLGSAHELLEGEIVRGTADRRGLFHRGMVIQFDGLQYLLEPAGLLSPGWYLVDVLGNRLLEIQPRGIFGQSTCLLLATTVNADLVTFAYYLVHVRRQEDSAVVAATAS